MPRYRQIRVAKIDERTILRLLINKPKLRLLQSIRKHRNIPPKPLKLPNHLTGKHSRKLHHPPIVPNINQIQQRIRQVLAMFKVAVHNGHGLHVEVELDDGEREKEDCECEEQGLEEAEFVGHTVLESF